jgi:hypothetical protein
VPLKAAERSAQAPAVGSYTWRSLTTGPAQDGRGARDGGASDTRRAGCAPADARMAGCCCMRRRRVSGAVTSTEIADDGLQVSRRASKRLEQMQARIYAHNQTHVHARARTRNHVHTRTHQEYPVITPSASPIPTTQLSLAPPALAFACTPSHTRARATAHTPNAHVDGGFYRCMDARMIRSLGALGGREKGWTMA